MGIPIDSPADFTDDPLTRSIIGAAIAVHAAIGPGLLESAYQVCLCHEIGKRGHLCMREVALPVQYDGIKIDCGYRLDMVVDDAVIIEIKCVEKIAPIHEAQLLTYLKLSGISRGLILNFNVDLMKNGILRRTLTRRSSLHSSLNSAPSATLR